MADRKKDDFEGLFKKLDSISEREYQQSQMEEEDDVREYRKGDVVSQREMEPTLRYRQPKKRRRKHGKVLGVVFFAIIIVALSVLFSSVILLGISDVFGIYKADKEVTFTISKESSPTEIAEDLQKQGLIKMPALFKLYVDQKDITYVYESGEYKLNTQMAYDEILGQLRIQSAENNVVTLTFPEGLNIVQIANMLEKEKVCSAEDFLNTCNTGDFQYDFLSGDLDNGRYYKLEGYIFPDTYNFYKAENVNSVIKKFLDNFGNRFNTQMRTRAEELGMSIDEVVNLASIIQKEASDVEEMGKVSSVFLNRLADPATYPRLQSDVTIFYVNDYIKPNFDTPNQSLYDSYNTYVCTGLPVGPVANPGLQAMEAVLNPEATNYYFFVTDQEGKYYYAQTLAEHDQNCAIAEAVGNGEIHGVGIPEEQ